MRMLYAYLRERPWDEAVEILRRIREEEDPIEVLRLVQDSDLLLNSRSLSEGRDDKRQGSMEMDGVEHEENDQDSDDDYGHR